jgi:hypothetical protein
MNNRIMWTHRERQLLADYVASYLEEWNDYEAMRLLREGQRELLPQHRQRPDDSLRSISRAGWLKEMVEDEWDAKEHLGEDTHGEGGGPDDGIPEERVECLVYKAARDVVSGLITPDMVYQAIKEAVAEQLAGQELMPEAPAPAPAREDLPVVLVVGPKGDQGANLREQFRGRAEIKVQENANHASPKPVEKAAKKADFVVAWTRFMSHSAYSGVTASGTEFVAEKGGLNSVVRRIEEYLSRK